MVNDMNPSTEHDPGTPTTSSAPPYYALRPVMVRIPPDMHRRLRALAAAADMSMGGYLTAIVTAHLGDT